MQYIMNVFEEITESYRYNGVVSLKALEDDIVTLENQIDSFNATLREIQLRGKKPGILVGKIRDAKIKLSLVKAVYKKESDKNTTDDVILNMLGVSAKNANEIQNVNTAADGREPKPQNFESAELETVVEETDDEKASMIETENADNKDVTVIKGENQEQERKVPADDDVKDPEVKVINGNSIAVADEDKAVFQSGVLVENSDDETTIVGQEKEAEGDKWNKILSNISYDLDELKNRVKAEQEKEERDMNSIEGEAFGTYSDTEITKTEENTMENDTRYVKSGDTSNSGNDSTLIKVEEQTPENDKMAVNGETTKEDTVVETVPPPTIDDYTEPESGPYCEAETYGEDYIRYDEATGEPELNEVPVDVVCESAPETDIIAVAGKSVVSEEGDPQYEEVRAYDAFTENTNKIYAAYDLHEYTNMVNTDSVKGYNDGKKKELQITFTDIRDYPIFIQLANERLNGNFFTRLFKKRKSIFMDISCEMPGVQNKYRFEYSGCRVKEVYDSEYQSWAETIYYGASKHGFTAVFKYKKLKIV